MNAREINKNNIIARLLGEKEDNQKFLLFPGSDSERIGNFSKLKETAQGIHDRSKDHNVTMEEIRAYVGSSMDAETQKLYENLKLNIQQPFEGSHQHLCFSNNGLAGFCNQLGVPAAYIRHCMGEDVLEHASEVLNFWVNKAEDKKKKILIRATADRIHGVLSSKYSVFDDHEVLDVVDGILGPKNEYAVKNYCVNEERMKLRIINRDKVEIGGRPLSFGFDVSNSRVGRSSLDISVIIFDHICSNGMIFGGGSGLFYNKRHVGINRENFISEFTDMLDLAPDTVNFIRNNINTAAGEKLNGDSIQRYLDKFKAEGMSKNIAGRVEQRYHESYDKNLFGFISAVTEVAQDYEIDTRERMERFAGMLIQKIA